MWLYFLSIKKPKLLNYRLITRYVILLRNHRENSGIMVAVLQKKKMADRITQLQDAVNSVGHFIYLPNILLKENLTC